MLNILHLLTQAVSSSHVTACTATPFTSDAGTSTRSSPHTLPAIVTSKKSGPERSVSNPHFPRAHPSLAVHPSSPIVAAACPLEVQPVWA
tara:strand:+ start:651 stop:920 length:270 start_codon:yes stop_codon:yes gene_type:complete